MKILFEHYDYREDRPLFRFYNMAGMFRICLSVFNCHFEIRILSKYAKKEWPKTKGEN